MTLTAPIPLTGAPVHDLRTAILEHRVPITATVHVAPGTIRNTDAWRTQLRIALRTGILAMTKNLEPAGLNVDDGVHDWRMEREPHGDGWLLTGIWSPL